MEMLSILFVVLIGGTFMICAAAMPFSAQYGKGRRRSYTITAGSLAVLGAAGFFGSALSAVGGLDWLPSSFEWPVGYTAGVISTGKGWHIVPHTPSGRVQVYDANWSYLTGWHVDAGGGIFKLLPRLDGNIDVITARGQLHYVFAVDGQLISKETYEPLSFDSFPQMGESMFISTYPWLLTFSHPFLSWATAVAGLLMLAIGRSGKK